MLTASVQTSPSNCIDVALVCCPGSAMKETRLFRVFSHFWTSHSLRTETTLDCLRTLHHSAYCFYRRAINFSQVTMCVLHGSCVKREKVISFTLALRGVHGANRTTSKFYDLKRQENDRMSAAVVFSEHVVIEPHAFAISTFYKWSQGSMTGARQLRYERANVALKKNPLFLAYLLQLHDAEPQFGNASLIWYLLSFHNSSREHVHVCWDVGNSVTWKGERKNRA